MFALCANEDLPFDISCELKLDFTAAEKIGAEIVRKRYADSKSTDEIVAMIRELGASAKALPKSTNFWKDHDAYMQLRGEYFPR
jgi:hypothetical protein